MGWEIRYVCIYIYMYIYIYTHKKVSQMKNLKVWQKFETLLDCPVSWQQWYSWSEEWLTGGSTMEEEHNMTPQQ